MIAGRFQNANDIQTYSHAKSAMENENFGTIGFYSASPAHSAEMARKYNGKDYTTIDLMLKDMHEYKFQ